MPRRKWSRRFTDAGGIAIAVGADVSKEAEAIALMDATEREYGRIDYLINNAGWSTRVPHAQLGDLTDEIWDRTLNVNLRGVVLLRARGDAVLEKAGGLVDREHFVGGVDHGAGQLHCVRGVEGGAW